MGSPSDSRRLYERLAAGDDAALEALLDLHLPELRAFVRLRTGWEIRRKESSSDVVQSVCREILQHRDRFRHPGENAFKHWLFLTALRKLSNKAEYWRAAKREAAREVRPSDADADDSHADRELLDVYGTLCTPSRELVSREEVQRIEATFDQLSEEHREVITLSRIVRLSHAEIAEKLGRSEQATRQLLFRALSRLAELLEIER